MKPETSFFAQFDPALVPHIAEFARRLTNLRADVYMLMARKATCFVEALSRLRLATLSGVVTTDRVLDMERSWLAGKSVVIVDEALISGTTLYRTEAALHEAGVAACETHVFCVNTRWWSKELAQPVQPYLLLDDKQTTGFCADIVDAISVLPLPYSVDFPHLSNVRVPSTDIHHLWTATNWNAHDVTSSLQRHHGVASMTLIPDASVVWALDQDLGWPVSTHTQLLKIRTYARRDQTRTDRDFWWCQFVPMVVLDPLSTSEVDELWARILAFRAIDTASLTAAFTTASSRLRLIQYVIAMRLWRRYTGALALDRERFTAVVPSLQSVRNVFPPQVVEAVARACVKPGALFTGIPPRTDAETVTVAAVEPSDVVTLATAQRRLTEPFLKLYYEREMPARQLVLQHGKAVFAMAEFENTISRLRAGFSLPELRAMLDGVISAQNQASVLSLFLDHAVDHGIIVPLTRDDAGTLYRAYRHGEDVLWGQSEERLAYLLVEAYLQSSGREHVPRIWLEKLLVLLIRIGVQQSFLRRYNRTLGDDGTVGVRYSLKGAVVKAHAPKLYGSEFDGALSGLLLESGTLAQDDSGQYRLGVAPPEEAPTKKVADTGAILIGSVFGMLHAATQSGDDPNLRLTDQDLIILATSPQPNDAAAAVAAEIALFIDAWRYRSNALHAERINRLRASQLLEYLARPSITEALTSGEWKYRSFANGAAWQVIDRIEAALKDPVYRQTWRGFWSSSGAQPDAVAASLRDLLAREGRWMVRANVMLRALELALNLEGRRVLTPDKETEALIERLEVLLTHASVKDQRRLAVGVLRDRLRNGSFSAEKLRRFAAQELDRLAYEGKAILDLVDTTVAPFGQLVGVVMFQHMMFVTVTPHRQLRGRHWDVVEGAVHAFRSRVHRQREKAGRTRIDLLPAGQPGFEHGRWICASGVLARTWLIRLAADLLHRLGTQCTVRCVLFAHMLPEEQLVLRDFTNQYVGFNFWSRAVSLFSRTDAPDLFQSPLGTVTPVITAEGSAVRRDVLSEKKVFKSSSSRVITDEVPAKAEFRIDQYSTPIASLARRTRRTSAGLDIGIITIVPEEMRAVRDGLARHEAYQRRQGRRSARIFYYGSTPSANGAHRVIATQALSEGNRSVILAYNALRVEGAPLFIVLLGIGGGIHPSLSLGDVAIADRILYYDERKETASGVSHRLSPERPPAWILPQLKDFFVENGDPAVLRTGEASGEREFRVRLGPIGSGEAVIGYRESHTRQYLRDVNDKTLAVETEAGGVARAFYEEQLEFDARTKGYLIVRGISDHADEAKDDQYRLRASENAIATLEAIVRRVPTLSSWRGLERL